MNNQYVDKLSSDELVMQFVEAPDWSASETLVLQNSEFLSDNAEKLLRSMIEVANAISDTALNACGEAHRELLSRCRASGVVNAFRGWSPPVQAKVPGVRVRYCEALDTVGTTLRARYQKSGKAAKTGNAVNNAPSTSDKPADTPATGLTEVVPIKFHRLARANFISGFAASWLKTREYGIGQVGQTDPAIGKPVLDGNGGQLSIRSAVETRNQPHQYLYYVGLNFYFKQRDLYGCAF
jgi:hypothetical protein